MKEIEEIFIGWNTAMQVLNDNNYGITGDLLSSMNFDLLLNIKSNGLPTTAFDYGNFIKAMKNFCSKHTELKKIYFSPNLMDIADGTVIETSMSILDVTVDLAENLGLLIKSKEALAIIKDTFKQDPTVAKALVLALGELITHLKNTYSKDTKPMNCLFAIELLKEWASNKGFIQDIFNGVDYSWFPDEDTELAQSQQLLAK
ncbi:MAG: hypothetical protein WAQ98_18805 [Blastocatellia bacterium]